MTNRNKHDWCFEELLINKKNLKIKMQHFKRKIHTLHTHLVISFQDITTNDSSYFVPYLRAKNRQKANFTDFREELSLCFTHIQMEKRFSQRWAGPAAMVTKLLPDQYGARFLSCVDRMFLCFRPLCGYI